MLVDAVELKSPWSPSYRTRSLLGTLALVAAGLVVGGAVSAAAVSAGYVSQADNRDDGIVAPEGVLPGAPVISLLGDPVSQQITGAKELALPTPPKGSTHVRVTISCLTPGTTTWGLDPSGNNPSSACTRFDLLHAQSAYFDFALSADDVLDIRADADVSSMVTYQYLALVETAWGVNANGETFGVLKDGGETPDLVSAIGVASSGKVVDGYLWASTLEGPLPTSPAQALEWQAQQGREGRDIPLYASDGRTQLGVVHLE
jgi:hypothetical protein